MMDLDWSLAPQGWNWAAQDEDGRWFWYRVQPMPNIGGGVWRAPSKAQMFAFSGEPNLQWYETQRQRLAGEPSTAIARRLSSC